LFPLNQASLVFLEALAAPLSSRPRVLDLGSATASLARALADRLWQVTAIEPSPALMSRAEEALRDEGPRLVLGDHRDLGRLFGAASLDLLLCLGNTLPHLASSEEVRRFLEAARLALAGDSALVLQLLNYDLVGPGFEFPPLGAAGAEFRRAYSASEGGKLAFETELRTEAGIFKDRTELLPLRPGELGALLAAAGFSGIERFAGWDGSPFRAASSPFLIVVARP